MISRNTIGRKKQILSTIESGIESVGGSLLEYHYLWAEIV